MDKNAALSHDLAVPQPKLSGVTYTANSVKINFVTLNVLKNLVVPLPLLSHC
jgi:hypothetical protein